MSDDLSVCLKGMVFTFCRIQSKALLLLKSMCFQGDKEAELGLPFSPLCDRKSTLVAQSQIGECLLPLHFPLLQHLHNLFFFFFLKVDSFEIKPTENKGCAEEYWSQFKLKDNPAKSLTQFYLYSGKAMIDSEQNT